MPLPNESFKIVTPTHVLMHIKDWPLVDPTLTDPTNANALVMGEWLTPFINGQGKKLERDAAGGAGGHLSWVCYAQKGAYDIQFQKIVPVLMHGGFMADTWLFNRATGLAVGDELGSFLVAIDGINRSVLDAVGAGKKVAVVLQLPGSATSPLRVLRQY
jgi:hypothetical protein